jgi:cytochrome P450
MSFCNYVQEIVNPANKPPFLAFGGGPRLCPGADFAKLEISIFLHHLVTKYQWELCGGDEVSYFPVPKLSKGLQLRVKKCVKSTDPKFETSL